MINIKKNRQTPATGSPEESLQNNRAMASEIFPFPGTPAHPIQPNASSTPQDNDDEDSDNVCFHLFHTILVVVVWQYNVLRHA